MRLLAATGICAFTLAVTLAIGLLRHMPAQPAPQVAAVPAGSPRASFERFGPVNLDAGPQLPGGVEQQLALGVGLAFDEVAPSGELAPRAIDGGAVRITPRHAGLTLPEPTPPAPEPEPAAASSAVASVAPAAREPTAWREGDPELPPDIESIRPRDYQRDVAAMLRSRIEVTNGTQARIAGAPIWVFRGAEYRWVVCVSVQARSEQPARIFEAVYLSGRLAGVVADDGNRCGTVSYVPFPEATQAAGPAAPSGSGRRSRERAG